MNKIILPFTTNVEAKAYQYSAHALGAIKASLKNSHLWAAGKFLSVYFESNNQLHMYDADFWSINEGITTQECMVINPSANDSFRKDLLEFIKNKIRGGSYIVGMYDEYYIPKKKAYQEYHFLHDYLVYGFDDTKNVLKSAGYLSNSRYEAYEIPYEAYIDSITLCDCDEIPLYYRYVDNQYVPKLAITDICNKFECFLSSKDDLPLQQGGTERIYGISGLNTFQRYIAEYSQEELDLRNSRSYTEYFQYMYSRLQTLSSTGYLCDDTLIREYYNRIVKPSLTIHNMCIKYNVCGNKDILLRAGEIIQTINHQEVNYITLLLDKLEFSKKSY